jgi:hypothetical protein
VQSIFKAPGVRIKNDILHRGVSIGLALMQIRWKTRILKTVASGSNAGGQAQLYEKYSEHRRARRPRRQGNPQLGF